jgi:hypothetical protein
MSAAPFKFLSDEDFLRLEPAERLSYIDRAQKELAARQRVLREQIRMTIATDTDSTVPVPSDKPSGTKPARRKYPGFNSR